MVLALHPGAIVRGRGLTRRSSTGYLGYLSEGGFRTGLPRRRTLLKLAMIAIVALAQMPSGEASKATISIEGTLVDAEGRPAADVEVVLVQAYLPPGRFSWLTSSASEPPVVRGRGRSDSGGRFRIASPLRGSETSSRRRLTTLWALPAGRGAGPADDPRRLAEQRRDRDPDARPSRRGRDQGAHARGPARRRCPTGPGSIARGARAG